MKTPYKKKYHITAKDVEHTWCGIVLFNVDDLSGYKSSEVKYVRVSQLCETDESYWMSAFNCTRKELLELYAVDKDDP